LFELLVSKLAYPPINTSKGTKSIDGDNYPYLVPKSSSYHIENAMDLICNKLRIRKKSRTDNKSNTYYENYHLISSMIPLDNSLIQQALGSLLSYIQANILSLDDDINITSIGEYHKKKYMRVDENSIRFSLLFPYISTIFNFFINNCL